jgi:copper(I)-binding protein
MAIISKQVAATAPVLAPRMTGWKNPHFLEESGMGILLRRALRSGLFVLAGCGSTVAAVAQPAAVKDAWVRAPAPGQSIAGAYMEITGRTHYWLVAVASPAAARAELHATALDEGVTKMRPVESIELPGGRPVKLAPGGLHIMLVDLKQALKPGAKVPITLTVLRGDRASRAVFTVQAEVRGAASAPGHPH